MQQINTPLEVIDALVHGTNMWLTQQRDAECVVRPHTAGSLKGTDMLLTMAFNEQFHTIGWINLFSGRISKLWGKQCLKSISLLSPPSLRHGLHKRFYIYGNILESYGTIETKQYMGPQIRKKLPKLSRP